MPVFFILLLYECVAEDTAVGVGKGPRISGTEG